MDWKIFAAVRSVFLATASSRELKGDFSALFFTSYKGFLHGEKERTGLLSGFQNWRTAEYAEVTWWILKPMLWLGLLPAWTALLEKASI